MCGRISYSKNRTIAIRIALMQLYMQYDQDKDILYFRRLFILCKGVMNDVQVWNCYPYTNNNYIEQQYVDNTQLLFDGIY